MGCAVGKEKPTQRETKFIQKAQELCENFNELKIDIIKTRNLLYQKFNIKNRIKSGSGDSKNSIDTQTFNGNIQNGNKDFSKNTTFANIQNDDQPTREQIQTLQHIPNTSQMVNIEDFIMIDTATEWKYFKETYIIYTTNHKNTQKICDMCRFFLQKMEEQVSRLEEMHKQSDILYKCVRAFKNEMKNKRSNIFNDLGLIIENSKKLLDQLKSTKSNVSQLSLMTLVADTSDSLVNCNSIPAH
ncbi:hypothetical protein ABPG72_003775 [Tetrahymena utriculariae]